jgi:hypothetical protein
MPFVYPVAQAGVAIKAARTSAMPKRERDVMLRPLAVEPMHPMWANSELHIPEGSRSAVM